VVRTVSPFGPVAFHASLCLQWAAVTTEVCLLSVVQKLLLSANYSGVENVGSHAFRHNYISLCIYVFNIFNFQMLIKEYKSKGVMAICN